MPGDDQSIADAIRRQEERLARDPASLAFAQLADLYRKAGRTRDAVALCRDGLARYPHYTTARLILAKALAAAGDLDAATIELAAILAVSPKDVQCLRLAAEVHRRRGHIDEAVQHLEAAADLDPGDRESRALLGLLRSTAPAGDAGGLARVLSDDTFTTVAFGSLCLEQGCVEEAAQVFTRILRKDPEHHEARPPATERLVAMQVSTAEFKKGLRIVHDGNPYTIVDFQHVKPGKGGAFVRTKLKHMKLGKVIDNTFRSGEKVELVDFEEKHMQFLYRDDRYNFMDTETYEQVSLSADEVGEARQYLKENTEVDVLYIAGAPAGIELPNFVELAIAHTDPGVRGDTAQGGTKPATLETGVVVQVPLFLSEGDVVKVDTRAG